MRRGKGLRALRSVRTDQVELERCLELRVCDMCLFEPECRRADEALKLGRLAGEGLAHEGDLTGVEGRGEMA
eukprot:scaffold31934_cov45-Isochrysis_galbana.AAC.1